MTIYEHDNLFIFYSFIRHKHNHYNSYLQAIDMKVESSIVMNNAYDRQRKDYALISSLFRNHYIHN